VDDLGAISRSVALAVANEAVSSGVAGVSSDADLANLVDDAMWWPSYVPYIRSRAAVHRDEIWTSNEMRD
jgi:malic enzyme